MVKGIDMLIYPERLKNFQWLNGFKTLLKLFSNLTLGTFIYYFCLIFIKLVRRIVTAHTEIPSIPMHANFDFKHRIAWSMHGDEYLGNAQKLCNQPSMSQKTENEIREEI